jgi:uronate dehydrogenase
MSNGNKPFKRLLLTGAAGNLGRILRVALRDWADVVRCTDISPMEAAGPGEEVVEADLADRAAVLAACESVDAIVHMGGISVEAPFDDVLQANILGTYNLYSAAQKQGVRRVIYASSNHAIGFYKQTEVIDANDPVRPDSMYGISKCFGESLSRYYFDRFGIETVCMRIGSAFEAPQNPRMLVTYLSFADLIELVRCSLFALRVDHTIVFGVSDNPSKWWDNTSAAHLGFVAKDSSRPFADRFPPEGPLDTSDVTRLYHGGPYVLLGPMEPKS